MEIDDDKQKVIQQQMEETRASLSTKLEALENKVADTVQTATDAVQTTSDVVSETVESVKESVGEIRDKVGNTVRSVASLFDISRQVEERPWLMFGGSIAAGCLVGWYMRPAHKAPKALAAPASFAAETPAAASSWQAPSPAAQQPTKPSWLGKEIGRLRSLAIGLVMGSVRDLAKQTLPETFSARVAEAVDEMTPQFGGEVIHGQILPDLKAGSDVKPETGQTAPQAGSVTDVKPGDFEPPLGAPGRSRAYAAGAT